jgi:lipoprotein-releasing system ATP-binding protein
MAEPVLRLVALERRYRTEAGELPVLRGADLDLHPGEIVALVAPSGSGKSTLLHLAGLLERPDGGEVVVEGRAAGTLPDDARTAIRRRTIGFVYQFHHLLPEFTAEENVILPQMADGRPRAEAAARALANAPRVLLADEPTGNLDVGTAAVVFEALLETVRGLGMAALVATHNPDLARRMDRVVTLREGRIAPA